MATTTYTTNTPAATQSSTDPGASLQQLQNQLDQAQTAQDQQTRQNAALKQNIAALQSALGTINQIVTAYDQANAGVTQDVTDLTDYRDTKETMVEALLGTNKAAIDTAIAGCDKDIADAKQKATDAHNALKTAKDASDAANADLAGKQQVFDDLKNLLASISKKVADAKSLRKDIDSAEQNEQWAWMYFLLQELKSRLDAVGLQTPDAFETNVTQAWTNLKDARLTTSDKTEAWVEAKAAYDVAAKTADQAVKGRKDAIKHAISKYNAQAQAAGATASQSAQASAATPVQSAQGTATAPAQSAQPVAAAAAPSAQAASVATKK